MKLKYRYIIYKIFSWTAHKKNDTPIVNTILTLAFVHCIQLFTLFLFIDKIIIPLDWLWGIDKSYIFIGAIIYFILFYLLVYNKQRWERYINEFENENEKMRKKGNILVIIYLIGSILLFFISLPFFILKLKL